MPEGKRDWIPDLEVANANIKWNWSHFDGRADTFNDEGDHNFVLILSADEAQNLASQGWAVKEYEGREEGDPPEYTLKCKISYRFEPPKVYLIKSGRKFRADERDLADIKRTTTEKIDVILQPSPWVNGNRSGITAYVKELYATIQESRFAQDYQDYEEI